MIEVRTCDVAHLSKTAPSLLDVDDARNNLLLGVLKSVAARPSPTAFGWELMNGTKLVGVCLATPPFPMLLSPMSDEAADAVANAMVARALLPYGIQGLAPVTQRVSERLAGAYGAVAHPAEHLRLFELRKVVPVLGVPGRMRVANAADTMQLVSWYAAFEREALAAERRMPNVGSLVQRLLAARVVFVWERAGELVAFAVKGREVGAGASVGPVYTPPARRGRGYASALVAALSQHILDEGKMYTCLFTDLTNPVSNRIYPKLGYVPLAEFKAYQVDLLRG